MKNQTLREARHTRIRKDIAGTTQVPRLSVFRSSKHIYAQIIDDTSSKTLVAACDKNVKGKMTKLQKSEEVGKIIAQLALDKKIEKVVFDRGGHAFGGRVAALAKAAREKGLKF